MECKPGAYYSIRVGIFTSIYAPGAKLTGERGGGNEDTEMTELKEF